MEKLRLINKLARELDIEQKILLRVVEAGDNQYPGQYAGFHLDELADSIEEIKQLTNIKIDGVTSFPCFLCSDETGEILPTKNLNTLKNAKRLLEDNGMHISALNTPSCTSTVAIEEIKRYGGTQGEPGHSLTGTTPLHAKTELPEKPGYVYVSEVSHNFDNHAYIYGGGYYRRGHLENVLFVDAGIRTLGHILPFADSNIDYFLESDIQQPVGTSAIMSFRTQIFTTRSEVALVEEISKGEPKLVGIYDSQGKYLRR